MSGTMTREFFPTDFPFPRIPHKDVQRRAILSSPDNKKPAPFQGAGSETDSELDLFQKDHLLCVDEIAALQAIEIRA